ncbi:MAG: tRNA (adenosine(37)-N6)-threonylcarbamoyltransferase complex ATPase subunit type 1 TsaE [Planctomycetales bacterium]|nr:tRNA (adenosine(37)-N6)-threonylcarbamoyltransferase complex ATPase subunit type 1 TsaE [Planctomycetales bacterium]
MNVSLSCQVDNESQLDALAQLLLDTAPPSAVVLLRGTLGAGKTRLVRGVAAAAGIDPATVVSPTFVLCQTYTGEVKRATQPLATKSPPLSQAMQASREPEPRSVTIHHVDAYRLADEDEYLQLGADEFMESEALTFVEWGDRVADALPQDRLEVELIVTGEQTREVIVQGVGDESSAWVERLRTRWSTS